MIILTVLYLIVVGLIARRIYIWITLSIVRVFIKTKGRRAQTIRGDTILLLGPCDSGKTCFFYVVRTV